MTVNVYFDDVQVGDANGFNYAEYVKRGGDKAVYEAHAPVLKAMGGRVIYLGGVEQAHRLDGLDCEQQMAAPADVGGQRRGDVDRADDRRGDRGQGRRPA